jgi:hypothetical protein
MELQKFYDRLVRLKSIASFDDVLQEDECGKTTSSVQRFEQTENGIEVVFGKGDGLVLSKAIVALDDLVKLAPNAIVHTVYEKEILPLKYVYEDVPIFIVEFELPIDSEWR